MSEATPKRLREKVEPGIYRRRLVDGREVFEIAWRDAQGKQRFRRVERPGIKAARAALAEEIARRGRGERVNADPRLRFADGAAKWLEWKTPRVRSNTASLYQLHAGALVERFGRLRMSDVSHVEVAAYVAECQAAGAKGWTIKGRFVVLSGIYQHAARALGYVGQNPVAMLDRSERPTIEDEKPKRILGRQEVDRLVASVDDHYRLIFHLAAQTGARLGEALGLVWGNVDLDAATLAFTHQLDRRGQRVALKTKRSQRCIEITPDLVVALREHKIASARSGPHDLVFSTRNGTPHDHRNVAGRVLARAVQRAGLGKIERDGVVVEHAPTFHSLRHSHGSYLIAQGWDLEEVSARLGHSNIATTQRFYVHAYDAARRSSERRSRLASAYDQRGAGEVNVSVTPLRAADRTN